MKAYRIVNGRRCWVAQLPGDGGVDWGYSTHTTGTLFNPKAEHGLDLPIILTPYWQRRFAADCRRTNTVAVFV